MSHDSAHSQVVVVTGGGRGIGAAIARIMYDMGLAVCVTGPTIQRLTDFAAQRDSSRVLACQVDVTNVAEVNALSEKVDNAFGRVDVLVNNAGISPRLAAAHNTPPATWWRTFEVNLLGTYLCSTALHPLMSRGCPARVINLCSSLALRPERHASAYSISKLGVMRLTEFMNDELSPDILFFALNPGFVRTDMTRALIEEAPDESPLKTRVRAGRVIEPDRVGRVCYDISQGKHDAKAGGLISLRDL